MDFNASVVDVFSTNALFFAFLILATLPLSFIAIWFAWRLGESRTALSPYSQMPLRRGSDLSYYNMERVLRYLYGLQDYRNRIFQFRYAAVCRETGRIFPNSINWLDVIHVDWNFLQKRYPGKYVSWGSLTPQQQDAVKEIHGSLEGFQTEFSSIEPQPKLVEPKYALMKPGPLYVDVDSYVLLGWKVVPGTELEVLIVQRPRRRHLT